MVSDPLGAVPQVPFGHLHGAWRRFLQANWTDGAQLWSFATVWETPQGSREQRSGYVIVRLGRPGAYFLVERWVVS